VSCVTVINFVICGSTICFLQECPFRDLLPMPCDLEVWALGIRAPTSRSGFERCCFSEPIHLNPAVLYFFQHTSLFLVFFPSQGKIWSSLYRKENLQQLNEKSHEIMQEKLFNVSQRMTFQRGILGNASGRWIQIVEWLICWYILRCNDEEVGY
jgi:hypothetical protein